MTATSMLILAAASLATAAPTTANEAAIAKVQKVMKAKGILVGDLPPAVRAKLEALEAAPRAELRQRTNELRSLFLPINVDAAFVQAKMVRINRLYSKAGRMSDYDRDRVHKLLDQVSDSFSDRRYDRANRKLNELFKLLGDRVATGKAEDELPVRIE